MGTCDDVQPDDDASLYRLFGFSLFVGIKFRNKALRGHLRRIYSPCKRRQYGRELALMDILVESDKSVLPAIIKFQDRGKMTFPHKALLPFMRRCSKAIKQHLNRDKFHLHGKRTVLLTKQAVRNDKELLNEFGTLVKFRCDDVTDDTIESVYKDLIQRVINTMANSFLTGQAMLERIASNKGVDAQVALRDRLKAYATDTHSKIQL